MNAPLNCDLEINVDLFAGGGGASLAMEQAIGRPIDIAINHDPIALAMHKENHPHTKHYEESVWDVDPITVTHGKPIYALWMSPDCTHFSRAKGGKPKKKEIRSLANVVFRWVYTSKPRIIFLENVTEFESWGPLDESGYLIEEHKGKLFKRFVRRLRKNGYTVEWNPLVASDYGAPTIRNRLFLVARRDGVPITWPQPTHGDPKKYKRRKKWRTAAECIDWSIPTQSIFSRKKPLAENTMKRIAKGIDRYVINSADPFIIKCNHKYDQFRGQELDEPLQTVTSIPGFGLVVPSIQRFFGQSVGSPFSEPLGSTTSSVNKTALMSTFLQHVQHASSKNGTMPATEPLRTITANPKGGGIAMATAFLAKHYTGVVGQDMEKPIGTVTAKDHHSLVTSNLVKFRGDNIGQPVDEPLQTITAGGLHFGEVRAFLIKYYGEGGQWSDLNDPMGTITSKARMGIVTVHGEDYLIVDIGLRMLKPHELFKAQGFPDDYVIDLRVNDRKITISDKVRLCGNSVSPNPAIALIKSNIQRQPGVASIAA